MFSPAITLDLKIATPKSFDEAREEFTVWSKSAVKLPLPFGNGWQSITPEVAEQLLLRNPPGANRKAKLASVRYYAEQMAANDWQKTGQPLIFTDNGILVDGQHRIWACYFGGFTFISYVIVDVAHFDNIFAYIDSGRSRTATDALMTAGLNGQSSLISQAVSLNHLYEHGGLKVKGSAKGLSRLSHIDILRVTAAHPALQEAAHAMVSEYKDALAIIKVKAVAVFVAWKILESHNADLLDEFMSALTDAGIPMFGHIRKTFLEDAESADPMNKAGRIAYLIKLFNAWYTKQNIKRIGVRIDEAFPRFLDAAMQEEAA